MNPSLSAVMSETSRVGPLATASYIILKSMIIDIQQQVTDEKTFHVDLLFYTKYIRYFIGLTKDLNPTCVHIHVNR